MNKRMVPLLLGCMISPLLLTAQTIPPEKEVKNQWQSWISMNSTFRLGDHWGAIGDIHIRRTVFVSATNFYFLRQHPAISTIGITPPACFSTITSTGARK